jgi:hypothetical protein
MEVPMMRLSLVSLACSLSFGIAALACGEEATVEDPDSHGISPSPGPTKVFGEGGLIEQIPSGDSLLGGDGGDAGSATSSDGATPTAPPLPTAPGLPAAPFGCLLTTEIEPNDDKPGPMGPFVCGALASATDHDAFTGNASSKVQHIAVASTGDALFTIRGFGAEVVIDPAKGVDVPAFGSFARYEVHVTSPSGATLAYRIDVTDK